MARSTYVQRRNSSSNSVPTMIEPSNRSDGGAAQQRPLPNAILADPDTEHSDHREGQCCDYLIRLICVLVRDRRPRG
ncbi:hypothetical protein DACRYDRAFT_91200 [Dacryopinax primogenitus]|uniref:Uncharacterized protein n=1 Tax=Dacryopinax primogenitus (strain DJM 731) TaxID=1858805 RepID=M5FRF1_DACPD|nr:uncharacterized protein DACRYDRAFT_91200 [Dacryopinax primogenitus]EJT98233.1 hypothetical protein DACRYDRAFT_91200 [Dacryopinax primogenitus]